MSSIAPRGTRRASFTANRSATSRWARSRTSRSCDWRKASSHSSTPGARAWTAPCAWWVNLRWLPAAWCTISTESRASGGTGSVSTSPKASPSGTDPEAPPARGHYLAVNDTRRILMIIFSVVGIRCVLFFLAVFSLAAGPREFGRAQLQKAIQDRGLRDLRIEDSIVSGAPESYVISANRVTGADERGLMYGLLAAAEQIRSDGKVTPSKGSPQTPMRGIRYFLHNADLERDWYYSRQYWDGYLSMLAQNRFNRFNLVFAHQTDYLAPPYPFWIELPEFPTIRAKNL